MKRVKDYMVREIPILNENTSIREILNIFSSSEHNILPVVDEEGKLIGVVGLEDILENLILSKKEAILLEKLHFLVDVFSEFFEELECISPLILAEDIMKRDVVTVRQEDSIIKAMILMKKRNVHRLIVVDDRKKPIGYIGRNEICKALIR